jgi:signal transduction histidine kinase/ActR/RegA family two-component response regulator
MNLNFLKALRQKFGIKVFTIFTIFMLVISSSFTAFFIHRQRQSLTDTLIKNGKLLASILAHNSRIGVFSENAALLKDPVDGIFEQEEVLEVSVFNLGGTLLKKQERPGISTPKESVEPVSGDERSRNKIFEKLKESGSPFYLEGSDKLEFWSPVISGSGYSMEESLFFGEESLQKKARITGFVRITAEKKMLNKRIAALLFRSILIGIILLIIGSMVIYLAVKGITKPLKRLTEGVKALGEGGVVKEVPVETEDEIGNLAKAFNNMSESLKRREAEKHQLEDQLRHAQKLEAVGTLAGGIAHDFNNILGIILGYTELVLPEIPQGSSLQSDLNEVLKATHRAKELVNQILIFSRQDKQERKPVQISLIAKEVLKMLRATLPTTIEIRQNFRAGLAAVLSDPTQIHQVLMNLCTNAAHAMRDKGGVLEVSLADVDIDADAAAQHPDLAPGQYQKLTVSDTGHGMDRSVKERIFDPFFTTKGPGEGTGMGLAMVHGIAKSHDGAVIVRSEPGKGTTFQVFFPTIVSVITAEPEHLAPPPRGTERILFVDDEKPLGDIGKQTLEHLGYEVFARTSSIEALEVFKTQPDKFDLVITDMTMPNMTGADLAKAILHIRPDTPIILCTGFSEAISEEKAKAIGIREFVMKPIIRQKIARIIRRVLDQEKEQKA